MTILSPLISLLGTYVFAYLLALLYPLAQIQGINKIQKSKLNYLWMLHFPFWFLAIYFIQNKNLIPIVILLNSILGEILFTIIFSKFGRLNWFFFNSIGIFAIYFGVNNLTNNDFYMIIMLIFIFAVSAIFAGIGIDRGYLRN